MAELDKTVKDVYEAVLATYRMCKDKRQALTLSLSRETRTKLRNNLVVFFSVLI